MMESKWRTGDDQNLVRLALTCAEYRARHGDWPTRVAIAPGVLWNIVTVLGSDRFERASGRVVISMAAGEWAPYIRASDDAGTVLYSDVERPTARGAGESYGMARSRVRCRLVANSRGTRCRPSHERSKTSLRAIGGS